VLGATTAEPDIPVNAKLPLAQDVALVELHDSVDDCPAFIDVGLAESEAVGAGGGGGGGATEAACRWMPVGAVSTKTR
jgi:hypothetical protein